jgi:hypothetical protein
MPLLPQRCKQHVLPAAAALLLLVLQADTAGL